MSCLLLFYEHTTVCSKPENCKNFSFIEVLKLMMTNYSVPSDYQHLAYTLLHEPYGSCKNGSDSLYALICKPKSSIISLVRAPRLPYLTTTHAIMHMIYTHMVPLAGGGFKGRQIQVTGTYLCLA